jgi:hypothetical protein
MFLYREDLKMLKTIDIDLIDYNPYRDFKNYPIEQEQVDRIKASIGSTGFWHGGVIDVREVDGRYQIPSGHHTLEALKELGHDTVRCNVIKLDDDVMVMRMLLENSTQRGHNSAALLDSVAAVTWRLAYLMLLADGYEDFCAIVQKCPFDGENGFARAKGRLLAGEGIGRPAILSYAPEGALNDREVMTAIGVLKESGQIKKILREVKREIKEEQKRQEEELREIERQEKELAKRKASAQKEAEKRRQAKLKQEAEKERARRERAADQADQAAEAYKDEEFDARVANLFRNSFQLDTFRKAVTHVNAKRFIPVNQHLKLAKAIIAEAKDDEHLTGAFIKERVVNVVNKALGMAREISEREKKKILQTNLNERARSAWLDLKNASTRIITSIDLLESAIDAGAVMPQKEMLVLRDTLDQLESLFNQTVKRVRNKLKVGTNHKVIDIQKRTAS